MRHDNDIDIVEAIVDLQSRGYILDFIESEERFLCAQRKIFIPPHELNIVETYHFSRGDDKNNDIDIYAVEAWEYGLKGILIARPKQYQHKLPVFLNERLQQHLDLRANKVYS